MTFSWFSVLCFSFYFPFYNVTEIMSSGQISPKQKSRYLSIISSLTYLRKIDFLLLQTQAYLGHSVNNEENNKSFITLTLGWHVQRWNRVSKAGGHRESHPHRQPYNSSGSPGKSSIIITRKNNRRPCAWLRTSQQGQIFFLCIFNCGLIFLASLPMV